MKQALIINGKKYWYDCSVDSYPELLAKKQANPHKRYYYQKCFNPRTKNVYLAIYTRKK